VTLVYQVETCTNLIDWSSNGVVQQVVGTNGAGLQLWEGTYPGSLDPKRFFRLLLLH
jgi:hypothetical protein